MLTETLWIVNTRSCNFDCTFCYQGSHKWSWQPEAGLQKMMTARTLRKALDWAVQWPSRGLQVNWYGGEPLLNAKLMREAMPQWEARFKDIGKELSWSITTNGSLISRNMDLLDKHKVGILLSLDGPPHIHDKQRIYYKGKPTFQDIPVDDILAWRPNIEIAWTVDPKNCPVAEDLDWLLRRGFQRINFNLNWLEEWDGPTRIKLQEFARHVARRAIQSMQGRLPADMKGFNTNWMAKVHETFIKLVKPEQPCGTGQHMLALTPEGFLYPSQEMAFKAFEPGNAPGTAEYYKVGNVWQDPVIDGEAQKRVQGIYNDDMKQPPGFDCGNCAANPISFGGCHCRYIGQDGMDPAHRHTVAPGWCQSMQSMMAGMLLGMKIENYITLRTGASSRPGVAKPQESGPHSMHTHEQPNANNVKVGQGDTMTFPPSKRLDISDIYDEVMKLKKMLKGEELAKLQEQLAQMDQILRPIAKRLNKEKETGQ